MKSLDSDFAFEIDVEMKNYDLLMERRLSLNQSDVVCDDVANAHLYPRLHH